MDPICEMENDAEEAADEIARLREQLAAAQAREAKLHEGIHYIINTAKTLEGARAGCTILLRYPADDTALRERLAAERERCAKVCNAEELGAHSKSCPSAVEGYWPDQIAHRCAAAIRALGDE